MIKNNIKIILASASPRRSALLKSIGIKFTAFRSSLDEDKHVSTHRYKRPAALAIALASSKAEDVSRRITNPPYPPLLKGEEGGFEVSSPFFGKGLHGNCVIVAADTVVVTGDRVIGKPEDERHAGRILRLLSGKTHKVITGVCILKMPERICLKFPVTTDVTMVKMTDRDIRWYIKTGEPMDKAGAYGIQGIGGIFVKKINGSYTNVVGLPLPELIIALKKLNAIEMVGSS